MYLSPAVDKAVTRPTQWDHTHPMLTLVPSVVVPYSRDGAVTAGAQAQPCRRQQAKPHSPCDRGVRLFLTQRKACMRLRGRLVRAVYERTYVRR